MHVARRSRLLGMLVALALTAGLALTTVPASATTTTTTTTTTAKDKGLLAFVRGNQIYTATTSGGSVTKLTTSAKNYRPHWSPDGKRIAYVHEASAGHRDIWVMNADGSKKTQVTHLGDTTEPAWSPDGKWLAFGASGQPPYSSFNDYPLEKIKSAAPFGKPVVLPTGDNDARVAGTLDWSPNGKQIAFVSNTFPSSPDHFLLVYTLASHDVEMVDQVGGACCGIGTFADPAWSTNSLTITYSVVRHDIDKPAPAGPHLEFASEGGAALPSFAPVTGDSDADYSPSGKQVVFRHFSRVYIADANGTHRKNITAGTNPDWQPVG